MANVYFVDGAHYGHVYPTLGLVKELVRRGDRVIYFAGEPFRTAIELAGATFRTYDVEPPHEPIRSADQFAAYLLDYSALLLPGLIEQARIGKPAHASFDIQPGWG